MPQHSAPSGRFGQTSEPPVFMRMGRRFPIEAQPEIPSHSEGEFRDTVSASASIGKAHPVLDIDNGIRFPFRRPRETASRSGGSFRDGFSAWGLIRKLRPVLPTDSGTHFPLGRRCGNCVPLWGRNLGCSFRNGAPRETAAHFGVVARLVRLPRQALQIKNRLEREFQPVIPSSKCRTNYDCAPSRNKRRLK